MRITPNIIQSGFIDVYAEVIKSGHNDYIGLSGKIVDETKNTFSILNENKKKIIVKDQTLFHLNFNDGTIIEIDGSVLLGKPQDRIKKYVKRLW